MPLFKRLGNGLELTPKSRILAHKLTDIFVQLADATDEFVGSKTSHVPTVWTLYQLHDRLPDSAGCLISRSSIPTSRSG